jgi:hypothetical protein
MDRERHNDGRFVIEELGSLKRRNDFARSRHAARWARDDANVS